MLRTVVSTPPMETNPVALTCPTTMTGNRAKTGQNSVASDRLASSNGDDRAPMPGSASHPIFVRSRL